MNDLNGQDYDYMFKILFLGDSGTGKSSLILKYTDNCFNGSLVSSIGVDFKMKKKEINGKIIKIQIWDTAGHERFRTITKSYYRGANAIVIVYDITDEKSFIHVTEWLSQIEKYASEKVLIFLVGNKIDLVKERKVTYESAKNYADDHNIPFIETSAKSGNNINDLFDLATNTYLTSNNLIKNENNIKLTKQHENNQSNCC